MSTTAEERSREVTLNVLKRFDSHIQQYIGSAGHVALYEFDQAQMKWDRKDNIEGSMFVVSRDVHPWFQIFIMNKKSTDNFSEAVTSDFAFEINMPYLIYKNNSDEVIGIWFYDPEECRAIENLLHQVQESLREQQQQQQQQQQQVPPPPQQQQPAPSGNVSQDSANLMAALNIGGAGAAQPQGAAPPSAGPQLLSPAFFNQGGGGSPQPQPQLQPQPQPQPAGAPGDRTLQMLFARAATVSDPPPPVPVQQQQQQQEEDSGEAPPPAAEKRDKVRAVVQRLLANDAFVDMFTGALEAEGLL